MLVLNTTSPWASPSAPAAAPRNHVPSSSARMASIAYLFFELLRALRVSVTAVLSFQRRRHPVGFSRDHPDRRGPPAITFSLEANCVLAGVYALERDRRRAREPAIDEDLRAGRPRIDDQAADIPAPGGPRPQAGFLTPRRAGPTPPPHRDRPRPNRRPD